MPVKKWSPMSYTRRPKDQRLFQMSIGLTPEQRKDLERISEKEMKTMGHLVRDFLEFALDHYKNTAETKKERDHATV